MAEPRFDAIDTTKNPQEEEREAFPFLKEQLDKYVESATAGQLLAVAEVVLGEIPEDSKDSSIPAFRLFLLGIINQNVKTPEKARAILNKLNNKNQQAKKEQE